LNKQLNLHQWLERIEQLHPREIELGLERVRVVAERMRLDIGRMKTVVVGGTNGKGSTVASLQAIASKHGLSVGSYTSPHLLAFNERIRIDAQPVSDHALCRAFCAVEQAREQTPLTYFEFTTLAALYCFDLYQPHLCLLEVGLGGRLDAVNIIDADVTIVTNVQMDHEAWLGHDREAIAREKAGIFRAGVPAICAELSPPEMLHRQAIEKGAQWLQNGEDFSLAGDGEGWHWQGRDASGRPLAVTGNGSLAVHRDAAAAAIQAALFVIPEPQPDLIALALASVALAGRCQQLTTRFGSIVLDVAHNPAAVSRLASMLAEIPGEGKTHLLFAMLADKRADKCARALVPVIDGCWWLPQLQASRALPAAAMAAVLATVEGVGDVRMADDVATALELAFNGMTTKDRLVVTGSFFTVAAAMQWLSQRGTAFE
jgi:dihydrofolate synthase/folylpolyglutamate synthase